MNWFMIHDLDILYVYMLKIYDLYAEKLVDEPVVVKPAKPVADNKWEGEDEDDVKVSKMFLFSGSK